MMVGTLLSVRSFRWEQGAGLKSASAAVTGEGWQAAWVHGHNLGKIKDGNPSKRMLSLVGARCCRGRGHNINRKLRKFIDYVDNNI